MIIPLSQDAVVALSELRKAFPGRPMALIGATALGCHLPMRWRRTEDLDLVVALSIEDTSRILASVEGWSQNRHKEHEWCSPQQVRIDLIPISEQALACGVLIWPRAGTQMSLLGMQHVLTSQLIEFSPGLTLALPSVPIISLLKMASYLDRPFERERDLSDLAHILDEYPTADDDRLFESEIAELGLTLEKAMPFVLGRDLAALASVEEKNMVHRFLDRVRTLDFGRFVANAPWSKFEPEQAESRLDALELGFSAK